MMKQLLVALISFIAVALIQSHNGVSSYQEECNAPLSCQEEENDLPYPKEIEAPHPGWNTTYPPTDLNFLLRRYDTISVSFIGDVMQHSGQINGARRIARQRGKEWNNGECRYDYSHSFKYIRERIHQADIAVANMEFTVGSQPYSGYPRFSAPKEIAIEAYRSGIDLFLLANNHIADRGAEGLKRTLEIYDSIGIAYTGAYRNIIHRRENDPKIMEVKGVKIAFINFTYGTNGLTLPKPYMVSRLDSISICKSIASAKSKGAELIITLPHWGNEYELKPSSAQKRWRRFLIGQGVDVIVGTHPHVPQSFTAERSGILYPIPDRKVENITFYSLGNFISNQSIPDFTQLGMFVTIKMVRDRITREVQLLSPDFDYLWCFKPWELDPDYTVVPVGQLLSDPTIKKKVRKSEYERAIRCWSTILKLHPATDSD